MSGITNLRNEDAIFKLRELAEAIDICMFCTNLKTDDGASCRPMSTQKVCDEGNIWFFSNADSDKNKEIEQNNNVQLFYSHPGKDSFMIVNGEAEIIFDRDIIDELLSTSYGHRYSKLGSRAVKTTRISQLLKSNLPMHIIGTLMGTR